MKNYTCAFCGKQFERPEDRMSCERKCFGKQKAEEQKKKEEELAKAEENRRNEIAKDILAFQKKIDAFREDYGTVSYEFSLPFHFFNFF